MSAEQPSPKRFLLRFSLRSLLVLTAVVAAFFGGRVSMQPELAKRNRTIERQQLAIQQNEDAFGARMQLVLDAYDARRKTVDEGDELDELESLLRETELDRYLRRHSAGDGSFFLGPIPDAK